MKQINIFKCLLFIKMYICILIPYTYGVRANEKVIKMIFKQNITVFALALSIAACLFSCKGDPNAFEINGRLDNVEGSYFLASHEKGDSIIIDTIQISKEGDFSFAGKIDTLTTMCLYLNRDTDTPSYLYVFVDKGLDIDIKGDAFLPDLVKVNGGDINNDLTDFKKENEELLKSRAQILGSALDDSLEVKGVNGEKNFVMNLKNINFELSNIASDYVKKYPEKIASVMLINNFFKDEASIPRLDETLELLKGKAANFPLTEELKQFSAKIKMSSVGVQAPYFSLKDNKDKQFNINQFRGKYILLSFLSTDCDVCHDEKAEAIAVFEEMKKKKENIEFVSVIKDIEDISIKEAYSDSLKWTLLPEYGGWAGKTFDLYNIREIPYNILISPTGVILERDVQLDLLSAKLKELTATEEKKEK